MKKYLVVLAVLVCLVSGVVAQEYTEGSLIAAGNGGKELGACPLKSTTVKADISGFVARVNVRQEFQNTFAEPIEAVYVFPLGANSGVDQMTMTIGERVIRGIVLRREDARKAYETAKQQGKAASLLDQERPNIFTQSVANIMPGETIVVEISYVETLKYDSGSYEFVFPMTIGKRYIPSSVTDAARISPPMTTTRNGADVSIEVNLNAGVPVESIRSETHAIDQVNFSPNISNVKLRGETTIANKDFILRYDVSGKRLEDALLTHRGENGGFFTLILQPPDIPVAEDRTPKEIVFVLDTSGSMDGFPIEKAKEAMKLSMDGLYPEDTFNLITFAGDTAVLFDHPVPATRANLDVAQEFLASRQGSGGTEMMTAIKASLEPSDSQEHLRIVCFMTDGQVGNDDEIIAEIKRHPKARIFSFGIGDSVNRSLLDRMSQEGKGEVEYVGLASDGSLAAKRFYERVRSPLLTDISVDWGGMPVADVYPGKLTDLFSAKPVILHGRYKSATNGAIKLKGTLAGQPYERLINVNLPESNPANDSLATLWARSRVDELTSQQISEPIAAKSKSLIDAITNLGLEFGIMTKYTSFVAIEERVANPTGETKNVDVPNVDPATNGKVRNVKPELRAAYKKWINSDVAYIITKEESAKFSGGGGGGGTSNGSGTGGGIGVGRGTGTGSGMGSGNGSGYGNATSGVVSVNGAADVTVPQVSATVTVTAETINTTDTSVATTITSRQVELLPLGVSFASVLKLAPTQRPGVLAAGFQLDSAFDSSGTFTIDNRAIGGEFMILDDEYNAEFGLGGNRDIVRMEGLELARARAKLLSPNVDRRSRAERMTNDQLQGRIAAAAEPTYSAEAQRLNALGIVAVEIETDLDGIVVKAKAVSGNDALRPLAEQAAMLTRFYPTLVRGVKARISGKLLYDFESASKASVYVRKMKTMPLSADDLVAARRATKLHYWLFSIVEQNADATKPATFNESLFVKDGVANVSVTLTKRNSSVVQSLRNAGLTVSSEKGRRVVGSVETGKIASLADIADVEFVAPNW